MIVGPLRQVFRGTELTKRLLSVQLLKKQEVKYIIAFTAGDPGDKHKEKKKQQQEKNKPKTPTPAPTPTKEPEKGKTDKGGDKKKK